MSRLSFIRRADKKAKTRSSIDGFVVLMNSLTHNLYHFINLSIFHNQSNTISVHHIQISVHRIQSSQKLLLQTIKETWKVRWKDIWSRFWIFFALTGSVSEDLRFGNDGLEGEGFGGVGLRGLGFSTEEGREEASFFLRITFFFGFLYLSVWRSFVTSSFIFNDFFWYVC